MVRRDRLIEALPLGAALAAAGLLFARSLDTAPNYDEGVYLASMDALRHGQELGTEVFASQPPGFYVLLELIGTLGIDSARGVRLAFLAIALLGCLAAYVIGRTVGGRVAGLGAAALLAVAPPFPTVAAQVEAEVPAVTLALAAIALWLAALEPTRRRLLAVAAGAAFAAAVAVKVPAALALVPLAGFAASRRASPRLFVAFGAGAVTVTGIVLVAYAGALGEIWTGTVSFHADARATSGDGIGDNAVRVARFLEPRTPFGLLVPLALFYSLYTWIIARPLGLWPLWAYAGATALFLAWQRPLFDHHFFFLAAACAIPAGTALGIWVVRIPRPARFAAVAAGCLALAAGYLQEARRLDRNDIPTSPDITRGAAELARRSRPEQLVASDVPLIAFLADRRLPGELVDTSVVRYETGSLTAAATLREISENAVPATVVGPDREFSKQPAILAGLARRFEGRRRFGEVEVYFRPSASPP